MFLFCLVCLFFSVLCCFFVAVLVSCVVVCFFVWIRRLCDCLGFFFGFLCFLSWLRCRVWFVFCLRATF